MKLRVDQKYSKLLLCKCIYFIIKPSVCYFIIITSNKNLTLKYLVQSLIFLSIYHNN